MELLPITLTAQKGNWQRLMSLKANSSFLAFRDKVWARDDYTCRYCAFQAKQYQEVIAIDQNYTHMGIENWATACLFCAQCFFIDSIGVDGKSGATLIYLPEITQADLNHFFRTLFCSMLRETPYKGKLQAAYLSLLDRAKPVEDVFGPGTQDPRIFGQTLLDCELKDTQKMHPILHDLKLVPARKYYKTQSEYWKSTVFANIPL